MKCGCIETLLMYTCVSTRLSIVLLMFTDLIVCLKLDGAQLNTKLMKIAMEYCQ